MGLFHNTLPKMGYKNPFAQSLRVRNEQIDAVDRARTPMASVSAVPKRSTSTTFGQLNKTKRG